MADSWGAPDSDGAQATGFEFGTDNEAFASSDAFAGGEAPQEEAGRIQEDKVNKKKLAELPDDGKFLQIFLRPDKKRGLEEYTGVKRIPRNVATVCSNLLFENFNRKGHQYYMIEDQNLAPYDFVFKWIKQCGDDKAVANIPDEIKDLATSETGFNPLIDIMLVAQKLEIPTASFNKFILKKITPLAREYLIDLPTVRRIFDSHDTEMFELGLQELAATSVFSHWYDYKLDAPEYDNYMCELAEMRENIPDLDEALHKAVRDKDEWLKNKRQERREKQAAEEASGEGWGATDTGNEFGAAETPSFDGGDGSWNEGAAESTDDWVGQAMTTTNDWEKNNTTPASAPSWAVDDSAAHAGGDWADEMNGDVKSVPVASSGGW